MTGKMGRRLVLLALLAGMLRAGTAQAGPYLGDFGWCWKPECDDCPRREYSPLHFWVPTYYRLRACFKPSNVDSYPPGAGAGHHYEYTFYPCVTTPQAPTPPYADPEAYYGIPMVPPAAPPKDATGTTK
jgi:hypothetical protein